MNWNSPKNLEMQETLLNINLVKSNKNEIKDQPTEEVLMSFQIPNSDKKKFIRKINKYENLLKDLISQMSSKNSKN